MKKFLFLPMFLLFPMMLFAADEAPARPQTSYWQTLIMILIAIIFFYFILWRPERKRRKAMEDKRSAMKKGDTVVAMGIVGTIDKIKKDTVVLKMVDGSQIEFLKGAITEIRAPSEVVTEEEAK